MRESSRGSGKGSNQVNVSGRRDLERERESSSLRGHRKNIYDDRENDCRSSHGKPRPVTEKSRDKNVMGYYKSFAEKPSSFREMYESDGDKYSSSEDNFSSSSEDFPSPNSPHKKAYKRSDDDYGTLFNKVNDLQRRLYQVELKQRKRRASEQRV